jgi:hypothetical protein
MIIDDLGYVQQSPEEIKVIFTKAVSVAELVFNLPVLLQKMVRGLPFSHRAESNRISLLISITIGSV